MQYQQRQVNSSLFRAYDIRGIVSKEELDEDAFYSIGLAISCRLVELNRSSIFLAQDGRLTSPSLALALKQGLLDSGINVIDLGAVSTPVMYFATCSQDEIDSGLMVTGSHNPSNYNGIKIVLAAKTLVQSDIDTLYNLVNNKSRISGNGTSLSRDIIPDYIQCIVSGIQLKRPLKVVVDCGNGIAGKIIPKVLENLGCEVIPLFCEVDGSFPNHHPDPAVEENLNDLKKAVLENDAHLGLGFDGDADRLGLITNSGKMIWPDRLMMLYSQNILKNNPGQTIVFDVKCSGHLSKIIESSGGIARMCPTGHSIVKGIMKKEQAILAGEMSGHLFFKDRWYGFDDALYSACRLLEILSQENKTVDEQFACIPDSINTPEIKIAVSEHRKFEIMQKMSEQARFPGAKIITIDGIRVEYPYGWGLLRASNTTPCLVARFEADDEESLRKIQMIFKQEITKVDGAVILPF